MWKAFLRSTVMSMLAGLGLTGVMLIINFVIVPAVTMADQDSPVLELLVATFGLLVIALPFAVALALPLILGLGCAMVFAASRWQAMHGPVAWVIGGLLGAVVVWSILDSASASSSERTILAVGTAFTGIATALVFRRSWVRTSGR